MPPVATPSDDLARRVAEQSWYHVLDLPGGITTPGWFDLRPSRAVVPLPARLDGLRCLDVGTWDGFWAFEMERRGAAEVVAIDIDDPERWDWPPQTFVADVAREDRLAFLRGFKAGAAGFHLAHEALGSKVDRRDISVYDLDPDEVGQFDVVFLGSLLLHLRDPVRALDSLRRVCRGQAVIADTIEAISTWTQPRTPTARLEGLDQSWWWIPNRAGLFQMVESAGFRIQQRTPMYFVPTGPAHPPAGRGDVLKALRTAKGRQAAIVARKGLPHAAVLAEPLG
ncbi:bifunctional 2-polyprenyl-6-hydroxyphenol methylase/3-demethylubiquinol 3-O-methyltransferase UbiG [Conexibacter sp. SYSU D00693]|uniref:class I SAM-dependent methyltransferase n=1 Tax=Conexibacter sp. SYSU D00693 TaxID=2812560 RepID=UPI00196AF139|nr:methyltransferase domain-containing protein [Conexibacter sp. SYSU D00693]